MSSPSAARFCFLILILSLPLESARAQSKEFDELLKLIPPTATAVMLMDVDAIQRTPIAIKEDWKKKYADAYVAHGVSLPPGSRRIVLAAELNPADSLRPVWELGVLDLENDPSPVAIARAVLGTMETVEKLPAVVTKRGNYVIKVAPKRLGTIKGANRQQVIRWSRNASRPGDVRISDFLAGAARQLGPENQIVMAIDLADAIVPENVRKRLDTIAAVKDKKLNLDAVADVLAGLKGITVTVHIGSKIEGTLQVDFSGSAGLLAPVAKPLVLEALSLFGAPVEDLEKWNTQVSNTSITMTGEFTPSGLRAVLSVLEVPAGDIDGSSEDGGPTDEEKAKLQATMRYFRSLTTLINDVHKQMNTTRDDHAYWAERYADKIDQLPVLNVDDDLLNFSANVSGSLRYQALSKRSAGLRQGLRNVNLANSGGNNNWGPFGTYGWSSGPNAMDFAQVHRQEMTQFTSVRISEWQKIDTALTEMRRKLTKRYQTEF